MSLKAKIMTKVITLFLIILLIQKGYSQSYETRNKVFIPIGMTIKKSEMSKNCQENIQKNSIIQSNYTKQKDGKTFTISKNDTLKKDSLYSFDKEQIVKLVDFSGWVNIKEDEKDKSKLHLNPWLSNEHKVDSATIISVTNRTIDCSGKHTCITKKDTLKKDFYYRLTKIKKNDFVSINSDWFKKSSTLVEVQNSIGGVEYYLVSKFDQDAEYYLELENRDFISLKKRSVVFGPVTIPFKYRSSHKKNGVNIESEFVADFNAGLFLGKNWGRYRVRYENKELKKLSDISCTIGPFLSLSTATLDTLSTTSSKTPFIKGQTKTIALISPGVGIMLSVYSFNFGIFGGLDVGFGSSANNWNYNNQPWLGFGIAYNVTSGFWKK